MSSNSPTIPDAITDEIVQSFINKSGSMPPPAPNATNALDLWYDLIEYNCSSTSAFTCLTVVVWSTANLIDANSWSGTFTLMKKMLLCVMWLL